VRARHTPVILTKRNKPVAAIQYAINLMGTGLTLGKIDAR
jgi:hypothetical protein